MSWQDGTCEACRLIEEWIVCGGGIDNSAIVRAILAEKAEARLDEIGRELCLSRTGLVKAANVCLSYEKLGEILFRCYRDGCAELIRSLSQFPLGVEIGLAYALSWSRWIGLQLPKERLLAAVAQADHEFLSDVAEIIQRQPYRA